MARQIFVRGLIGVLIVLTLWDCARDGADATGLKKSLDGSDPIAIRNSGAQGLSEDGWLEKDAEIFLNNSDHSPAVLLEGINVQTGLPDESLRLTFVVRSESLLVATIASPGDFKQTVLLPPSFSRSDTLALRILCSKRFVPAKLGKSEDDRELSFRLKKIALMSTEEVRNSFPASYAFPRKVESDQNLIGIYSDGWMSDSASITLFRLDSANVVDIEGTVPLNVYKGIAPLDVLFDGNLLVRQQLQLGSGGRFQVKFQLPLDRGYGPKVVVLLKSRESFVPSSLGINEDSRRLSYRLQSVGLK